VPRGQHHERRQREHAEHVHFVVDAVALFAQAGHHIGITREGSEENRMRVVERQVHGCARSGIVGRDQ
jgi:hypothetical protein